MTSKFIDEALSALVVGIFVFLAFWIVSSAAAVFKGKPELIVLRDGSTGCEYLVQGSTLTPRLDHNGKQICRVGKYD